MIPKMHLNFPRIFNFDPKFHAPRYETTLLHMYSLKVFQGTKSIVGDDVVWEIST
jgi:hypothetical protein